MVKSTIMVTIISFNHLYHSTIITITISTEFPTFVG